MDGCPGVFSEGSISFPVLADLSEQCGCRVQSGFEGMEVLGLRTFMPAKPVS